MSEIRFMCAHERTDRSECFDPFDCHRQMLDRLAKKALGTARRDHPSEDRCGKTADVLAQVQILIREQVDRI